MSFFSAFIVIFLVMDPFGNLPLFLYILRSLPPSRRLPVLVREMGFSLIILTIFLFGGNYILNAMQLSGPALSISGGIILFLIAIRMIFPEIGPKGQEYSLDGEPFIVPLAVPLIAGPSATAVVILMGSREPDRMGVWFGALFLAWLATLSIMLFAYAFIKHTGGRFMQAVERLMGMILTAMAVQMLLTGIRQYITSPGLL